MLTPSLKRLSWAAAVLALLVVLYAVAGFWAVPHYLRSGLSDFVSTHYKRQLTVGEIRFNPFNFTLDVSDLTLPDSDGRPMLGFGHLHVDLQLKSLFKLGPSFREIVLDRPLVRTVLRRDGSLNLADLGKGFAEAPQPKPAKPSEPMRLYIDRFAVLAGSATFEDASHSSPFRADFQPITFELRNFSTRAKSSDTAHNEYSLTATSAQGERLDWNGTVLLEPLSSHGTFEVTRLQASTIWSYLQAPLPVDVPSGVIAVKGEYHLDAAGNAPVITVDVHDTSVADLKLRPHGGSTDYIALGKLDVQETQVDVAKRSVEIGKVSLSGGEVNAWLSAQGKLNLAELAGGNVAPAGPGGVGVAPGATAAVAPSPAQSASGSASPAPGPVWTVSVPDIDVAGFKVSAEDRQVSPALALVLDPLDVHVKGYNTRADSRVDVTAHTKINGDSTLNATAKLAPSGGGDVNAHIDLAKFDLALLQPFIGQRTAMNLLAGRLTTQLDVQKAADGGLTAKGDIDVADLRTVDELQQSFIKWKDLQLAGLQYSSRPASLRIATITAREPYARVIIAPDRTVNVEEVLAGPNKGTPSLATQLGAANAGKANGITARATAKAASAKQELKEGAKPSGGAASHTPPAPMMPMSIGTVKVIDGSANYADFWIQPNFAVGIQTLNGTVQGLSSDPKSRAKLKLVGKVDRYAPVSIDGEINLLAATVYSDVKMSFKGLELTTMTPYSGRFAGYKIDKGKLSVDLSYKVEQRKLAAEQHFVIDQLQLGDPVDSPDAVHLPLKLAVALLKDRNGVIDVPLPISGSLDDPQFKVGPIIWHALVNLLEKVALAPFAALGHLFGGHGEEMKYIDFPAGSADLDDPSKDKLNSLRQALEEKTQLQLDVPIVYSADLDRPVLARRHLDQRLAARAQAEKPGKKSEPDNARHYRLLVAEYQAVLGKEADLPPSAQAVQDAKGKKDAPPFEPAITDLEAALIDNIEVTDVELQNLGKARTRAIQDALLADGGVQAARVFIINGSAQAENDGKVRVEMALK